MDTSSISDKVNNETCGPGRGTSKFLNTLFLFLTDCLRVQPDGKKIHTADRATNESTAEKITAWTQLHKHTRQQEKHKAWTRTNRDKPAGK